ncbi:MAG: nucleotidyl transferase AbiEii/AbiGii toxin family protein [Anaerolineae bacterium]|nr:nucleotidyl transferase AbiEii/AbiGii toxin family protein [Anaerolineae bacterium]
MALLTNPHWETVPPMLQEILRTVGQYPFAHRFYLAGGTALALQLGHRYSVDLDFFSAEDDLSEQSRYEISTALSEHFKLNVDPGGLGHMQIDIQGNFVAFMSYGYPLLAPTWTVEDVQLANLLDIGLMKIDAIAGRGSRKDFYDLYFVAHHIPLPQLLGRGKDKYSAIRDFKTMALAAMVDFENADAQTEIQTNPLIIWDEVKTFFINQVRMMGHTWFET